MSIFVNINIIYYKIDFSDSLLLFPKSPALLRALVFFTSLFQSYFNSSINKDNPYPYTILEHFEPKHCHIIWCFKPNLNKI